MTLDKVPMMYRAQVEGRCSLQYGNDQTHLNRWTQEWINPDKNNNNTPKYQHQEPTLGLDGLIYRVKIKFNWRVFSNCGQDSILRPVIGKNGIPLIPGSSIKGIFRRLRNNPEVSPEDKQKIESYCGSTHTNGRLRFHHAYPLGDWTNAQKIVDICHPQQPKQVEGEGRPQAIALISLFEPILVFELSSITTLTLAEWENIELLLKTALKQGIGGKTSSGYGFYTKPQDSYPLQVNLHGEGVSSVLRSGEPEFRQNLFKAVLQGHVRRLLGGVTSNKQQIEQKINHLFGHTGNTGVLQYYWQPKFNTSSTCGNEKTPIYEIKGDLYVDIKKANNPNYTQDLKFIQKVLEFTLIMGGLGKSWRRVWHKEFMSSYKRRAIGCHWVYDFILPQNNVNKINNSEDLKHFLTNLANEAQAYLGITKRSFIHTWRESWHPDNVKVYTKVVSKSELIELFHKPQFKSIPAVGGKQQYTDQYDKTRTKFFVSCVWHRMLPIGNNQYLEIMTIFKGSDLNLWDKKKESFESEITRKGFKLSL